MKNYLLKNLTIGLLLILSTLTFIPQKAEAQYCGYEKAIYLYNYAIIKRVTIRDVSEGNDIYVRNSDWDNNGWATVDVTGTSSNPIELNIGNNFEITVNWGLYYRGYLRVYIDKNIDGRWETTEIGPDKEFLCNILTYDYNYYIPPIAFNDVTIPFNIGDDTPEGPSRIRVIANYGYYTTDPCISYANSSYIVGEIEDYAVNFVASLPEVYPTAGNILYNNERYDGTTREYNGTSTTFKLPAVESKGPQPTGTRIEYWITGPLPSNEVVYRALDPNTGSETIRFNSPTQTYTMQSATGPASVSESEGTFLPSKGGEYKVHVKLTKLSGKSAQGVKVFTVANNHDMSVAGIVSPRTNRYPRFFKYLVNTNIAVSCQVQNTGLNPVKKYEVTAKIYNAKTNALVSTQPKVVFDSDSDPNIDPIQSGEKHEVPFAAFQTLFTGEYYVKFEVSYTFDEEEYNNTLPRPDGEKYYFEVQYNDQLTAGEFESPIEGQVLKVNRPTKPEVIFYNNGISDASNISFRMSVKEYDPPYNEVYNEVSFLEDLPQGRYNSKLVSFPNMIITKPGKYIACTWVDYPYDSKKDDDTTCITFDVELGIQDTITVGNSLVTPEMEIVSEGFRDKQDKQNVLNKIEDINFEFVNISPNPASNYIIIDVSQENLELNIVDITGKLVFSDIMNDKIYQLKLENFESGVYTIIVKNENILRSKQMTIIK